MEIRNRSEIVFLYDIKDANPNGDPLDENKPRIDEETEINIVTDVRLKRTIRDYLYEYKGYDDTEGKDIFVREIKDKEGKIQDAKARAKDFENNPEKILRECIDVRLFGGTIPITVKKGKGEQEKEAGSSITLTGPVQFRFGRSLHRVEIKHIKGTGAFASAAGKEKKTFREEYILPYSLIAFYGIVNENSAKYTKATEEDIDEMLDAMWNGTKNLITRTKIGQMPRLLIRVIYREDNYHIGDLEKKISIVKDIDDKEIRNITDFKIDLTELHQTLFNERDKIKKVEIEANQDAIFIVEGKEYKGRDVVKAFSDVGGELKPLDR